MSDDRDKVNNTNLYEVLTGQRVCVICLEHKSTKNFNMDVSPNICVKCFIEINGVAPGEGVKE